MSDVALLLTGGALTIAGSVVTTVLTAHFARRSRHDERLWTRRADLYVALSELTPRTGTWFELSAAVTAFASKRVRELVEELDEASEVLNDYVHEEYPELMEASDVEREFHGIPEITRLQRRCEEIRGRLVDRIRKELGT